MGAEEFGSLGVWELGSWVRNPGILSAVARLRTSEERDDAWFGLDGAWFDLDGAWFGLSDVWFGLDGAWFGLTGVWFGSTGVWFGLTDAWFGLDSGWFASDGKEVWDLTGLPPSRGSNTAGRTPPGLSRSVNRIAGYTRTS